MWLEFDIRELREAGRELRDNEVREYGLNGRIAGWQEPQRAAYATYINGPPRFDFWWGCKPGIVALIYLFGLNLYSILVKRRGKTWLSILRIDISSRTVPIWPALMRKHLRVDPVQYPYQNMELPYLAYFD